MSVITDERPNTGWMKKEEKRINMENADILGTAPIRKLLQFYAWPSVIGAVVNTLYNVVDRIYIAQGVNSLALSGLSVTMPVMGVTQAVGTLVGMGAASRISILLGQQRKEEGEKMLGSAFLLSLTISSLVIVLLMIFARPLLMQFGASEASLPYALDYLNIVLPGNIFANITYSYNAVMRATGYPKKAMKTMLIGAVLNFVLDPVFLFVFHMGIAGVALATVISMFIGMIWVLHHFTRPDTNVKLRVRNFKFNWGYTLAIVSIGVAPFVTHLMASIVNIYKNRLLYDYGMTSPIDFYSGDLAVAANGVIQSVAMLTLMFMFGISQATQPILGYNYGAGNLGRVRDTFRIARKMNFLIGVLGASVTLIWPGIVARAFTSDPQLIAVCEVGLRIELAAMWAVGIQVTGVQFFQSLGKAARALLLSFSRQLIFLVPALAILPRVMGLTGVWTALPVADVLSMILCLTMTSSYFRKLAHPYGRPKHHS